jgi:hypothetical protein
VLVSSWRLLRPPKQRRRRDVISFLIRP